jgi:hypothetical protein
MTSRRLEKPEFRPSSGFAAIAAICIDKRLGKRLRALPDGDSGGFALSMLATKNLLRIAAVAAIAAAPDLASSRFSLLKNATADGAHEAPPMVEQTAPPHLARGTASARERRAPGAADRCSVAGGPVAARFIGTAPAIRRARSIRVRRAPGLWRRCAERAAGGYLAGYMAPQSVFQARQTIDSQRADPRNAAVVRSVSHFLKGIL